MKNAKWIVDTIDVDGRYGEDTEVTAKLHLDSSGHVGVFDILTLQTDLQRRLDEFNYVDTDSIREVPSLYPKMFLQLGRCNGKTASDWAFKQIMNAMHGRKKSGPYPWGTSVPGIKDVIFNDPATIVFWEDGTKTVVKTQDGDEYDPEKGLAMAISKKALGNKHEYYNVFKKWLKKYEKHRGPKQLEINVPHDFATACRNATENLKKLSKALSKKTLDDPTLKS